MESTELIVNTTQWKKSCHNSSMIKSFAGCWQMLFGLFGTSHFFGEQGSELGTVRIVYLHFRAPLADMKTRLGSHPTRHPGHEPRIAMLRRVFFRDVLTGMEAIISFAQCVLEIVAGAQSLRTQNVVQVQTFVAAHGGC